MVDANLFRAKMVYAGYSQRRLAKEIGMAENTLANKIHGRGYFNTDQVIRICKVLGITDPAEMCAIFLS